MANTGWYIGHHFTKKIVIRKRFGGGAYWFDITITDDKGNTSDITIYPEDKAEPIMWVYQDDKGDKWPFDPADAAREQDPPEYI